MMVLSKDDVIKYIKKNQHVPDFITDAREYKETLEALIKGKDYVKLLGQIDKYESQGKALARQKYTFSMKDLFERLFTNIENVWTATGGVKLYYPEDNKDEAKRDKLIQMTSHVRGGKSIEGWNESVWMKTYHTDPAGITLLEYVADKVNPFPVYVPIDGIRNYVPNGINLDVLLFEPVILSKEEDTKSWRLIDSEFDYEVIQRGKDFYINEERTFPNPFGQVPALINSDILDTDNKKRLSPIDSIVELCKEYLRDKSIKTIYKFLQGFPIFWRQVTECVECTGSGNNGDGGSCGTCNGSGYLGRRDITDTVNVKAPTEDSGNLGDIAGFIVPPPEVLDSFNAELALLEKAARMTLWGAIIEDDQSETATGRRIDAQPILQKLNKYSGPAETREQKITEWIANYADPSKDKNEKVSSIVYGRNYSLLSSDTVLEIYEKAKEAGDSSTILDRLFDQYLLSAYKNDPLQLKNAQLKANIEPYLHYTPVEVSAEFGKQEAQKKMLFDTWWRITNTVGKDATQLDNEFNIWVQSKLIKTEEDEQQN